MGRVTRCPPLNPQLLGNYNAFLKIVIEAELTTSDHIPIIIRISTKPTVKSIAVRKNSSKVDYDKHTNIIQEELQWVTMREVPQRLASPSEETPIKKKKKKKKSDKCINHFIQLNLELLNTGTVHSLSW